MDRENPAPHKTPGAFLHAGNVCLPTHCSAAAAGRAERGEEEKNSGANGSIKLAARAAGDKESASALGSPAIFGISHPPFAAAEDKDGALWGVGGGGCPWSRTQRSSCRWSGGSRVFLSPPPACPIGTNTWAMGAKAAHASEAGALVLHEPSSAHISEVFRNVALVPAGLWWAEGGMQPLVERGN